MTPNSKPGPQPIASQVARAIEVAAAGPPQRQPNGRFIKGQPTINPRGRPVTGLALAEMVRAVAGRPGPLRAVVTMCLQVALGLPVCIDREYQRQVAEALARGEDPPQPPANGEVIQPTMDQILRAQAQLAQWGFKMPPQELEVRAEATSGLPVDYGRLSEAELDELEASQRRLRALHEKAAGVIDVPTPGE